MIRLAAVAFLCIAVADQSEAELYGNYRGWKDCIGCHESVTKGWQTTRHAKAFDSLRKTSQEGLPGCVHCHVTGHEQDGGYIDGDLTPELAGVQCEECHGPAKTHMADPSKKEGIVGRPPEALCKTCHTPGQDKSFDFKKKVRFIHGG